MISCIGIASSVSSPAADVGLNEIGVRAGIQDGSRLGIHSTYELFAARRLPWDWRAPSGWGVVPQLVCAVGYLEGRGQDGVDGSAGFAFVIDKNKPGFSTDFGISFSHMSRRRFGYTDYGSENNFVSHIGINYLFANGLKFGYRFQHMSNGQYFYPADTPNPGVNMHLLGTSYVF